MTETLPTNSALLDVPALPLVRASILVVDDAPDSLALWQSVLKNQYQVRLVSSGESGLALATATPPPDLVLLNIVLPGMDGYAVCRALKAHPVSRDIPVIFLSAKNAQDDAQFGLALGAADYITKPIVPVLVLARLRTQLTLKAAADFLRDQNAFLAQEVTLRTREVSAIEDVTVMAMASLAETRDVDTGNHIRRTQRYVKALAWQWSGHPRFANFLTPKTIALLFKSAPLHDIGKVGIPDRILLKPGKLTPEEFEVMKSHTTLGRDAIEHAEQMLGCEVAFLRIAKEIAWSHQEKWDGSGYPQGLKGEQIPISARLMALADVYDALISRRVYKEPMPHADAVRIIVQTSGRHFDPDVVLAFVAIQEHFDAIALCYADSCDDLDAKRKYLALAQV